MASVSTLDSSSSEMLDGACDCKRGVITMTVEVLAFGIAVYPNRRIQPNDVPAPMGSSEWLLQFRRMQDRP
jgi:hypothetical protein